MVGAVWLVLRFEVRHSTGFLLSLGSALVGSLFAVINGQLAQRYHFSAISFYQMAGACAVSALMLPFGSGLKLPTASDLGWLLVLALVCTVYAYTAYVELLRRLSVFTINLVYNLEPVYGIVLAALILHEHRDLSAGFYAGTSIILLSVFAYPFIQRREKLRDSALGFR
jgi:drug/metabolite transporter (DMT)-like permease